MLKKSYFFLLLLSVGGSIYSELDIHAQRVVSQESILNFIKYNREEALRWFKDNCLVHVRCGIQEYEWEPKAELTVHAIKFVEALAQLSKNEWNTFTNADQELMKCIEKIIEQQRRQKQGPNPFGY